MSVLFLEERFTDSAVQWKLNIEEKEKYKKQYSYRCVSS